MADSKKIDDVRFTPGPWRVGAPPDKVCTNYGDESDFSKNGWGKVVATCKRSSWMKEGEEFSNATLVASAPDLLEALKLMIAEAEAADVRGYGWDDARKLSVAAISKAEARS